ncbi:MAG TPA: hypothetical protein VE619_00990 [Nitrososphaeraceae archaeon]|nr:hypothetical protein [Nitrososphaeraceae archaeon]
MKTKIMIRPRSESGGNSQRMLQNNNHSIDNKDINKIIISLSHTTYIDLVKISFTIK